MSRAVANRALRATAEAVGTTLNTAVGTALVQDTTADVHGLTRTSSSAGTATATLSKADGSATEAPHNRVVTLLETYIDVN